MLGKHQVRPCNSKLCMIEQWPLDSRQGRGELVLNYEVLSLLFWCFYVNTVKIIQNFIVTASDFRLQLVLKTRVIISVNGMQNLNPSWLDQCPFSRPCLEPCLLRVLIGSLRSLAVFWMSLVRTLFLFERNSICGTYLLSWHFVSSFHLRSKRRTVLRWF